MNLNEHRQGNVFGSRNFAKVKCDFKGFVKKMVGPDYNVKHLVSISNSPCTKSLTVLQTSIPPTARYINSCKICSFFARVLCKLKKVHFLKRNIKFGRILRLLQRF